MAASETVRNITAGQRSSVGPSTRALLDYRSRQLTTEQIDVVSVRQAIATDRGKQMAEPILREGSSGESVRELQVALKELGHDPGAVDGGFGPQTEAAVKAFQQQKGIAADGVVGIITWRNIDEAAEFDEPVLKQGSTGLPVRRAQSRLTAAGFDTGGVDGIFGPQTESGVKALQQATGLIVDGIVGPNTWKKIDELGD
jgi:peptidoglycan hydrolase-like protein with peptidoglycan-binding domain